MKGNSALQIKSICVFCGSNLGKNAKFVEAANNLAEGNLVGKTVGEELQVPTMQDKIWKMVENSDAFIALSGGIGTLEENFQIASWAQLNIHHKLISLLNVDGFFNKLLSFFYQAWEENFIPHSARQIFISASTTEEMIDKLEDFVYKPDLVAAQIDWSKGSSSKKRKMDLSLHL
ncbi:hypothetical protein DITRI_Ditri18aG0032800 [Diplodiscus trichospermus]